MQQSNCPACSAPVTNDARFCSHCGARLPDNVQRIEIKSQNVTEIKFEDKAKLEEVRLKYELEERKRKEKNESKRKGTKPLKIKLWVSWLLCIVFLCIGLTINKLSSDISLIFAVLFMATGVYAIIITVSYVVNWIRHGK